MRSVRRTLRSAAVASLLVLAPAAAAEATPATGAAPASVHVVADASTSTQAPSPTAEVTKGQGGDISFGYVLFGVMLLTLLAMGAWFLRSRRNRPQ